MFDGLLTVTVEILATSGAVSWMFHRQAHFVVTGENADEEILMDIVLDAGAEDIDVEDGVAKSGVRRNLSARSWKALEKAGIATEEAGLVRRPENTIELKDADKAKQVLRLIDRLEDLDDVQKLRQTLKSMILSPTRSKLTSGVL